PAKGTQRNLPRRCGVASTRPATASAKVSAASGGRRRWEVVPRIRGSSTRTPVIAADWTQSRRPLRTDSTSGSSGTAASAAAGVVGVSLGDGAHGGLGGHGLGGLLRRVLPLAPPGVAGPGDRGEDARVRG